MARLVGGILASLSLFFILGAHPGAVSRLEQIRARGVVTCGVGPGVPGFSDVDKQGRYSGFDVDICRALSAAIFGQPDRVRYLITPTIQDFLKATDIDQMLKPDPRIQDLLGASGGTGRALGLDAKWAYHIIKSLGNYGEIFERNVGAGSRIKLARGLNKLWKDGGLIYAPPLQ